MYAVFIAGGKQYKAKIGDLLKIEKVDKEQGSEFALDRVLLVADGDKDVQIGSPYIESAKVVAEVLSHGRRKKINIFFNNAFSLFRS